MAAVSNQHNPFGVTHERSVSYPAPGTRAQQAYGQPAYAISPEIEKIRSNASTARMLSFVSFLIGGLLLAGGMWFWTNKLAEEAKILGRPDGRHGRCGERSLGCEDLLDQFTSRSSLRLSCSPS